jgi:hypothetical protein
MAVQLTKDALCKENGRLFQAYRASRQKEWAAACLVFIVKDAHADAVASKDDPRFKQLAIRRAQASLALAEETRARVDAEVAAAEAAYQHVHSQLRHIELQEMEIDKADACGKTLEAYRAEVQPLKDLLIGHAQKLIHMMEIKQTSERTAKLVAEFIAAMETADADRKKAYGIIDSKALYYLRMGVGNENADALKTFIARMAY